MLASIGGVHGLRGTSLKRMQAAARADQESPEERYVEALGSFQQS